MGSCYWMLKYSLNMAALRLICTNAKSNSCISCITIDFWISVNGFENMVNWLQSTMDYSLPSEYGMIWLSYTTNCYLMRESYNSIVILVLYLYPQMSNSCNLSDLAHEKCSQVSLNYCGGLFDMIPSTWSRVPQMCWIWSCNAHLSKDCSISVILLLLLFSTQRTVKQNPLVLNPMIYPSLVTRSLGKNIWAQSVCIGN